MQEGGGQGRQKYHSLSWKCLGERSISSAPSADVAHGSTPRASSARRDDGSRSTSVSRLVLKSAPPTLSSTKGDAIFLSSCALLRLSVVARGWRACAHNFAARVVRLLLSELVLVLMNF